MGLVTPFLKGGLGELFSGGTDMADTFNTAADSWVENTSNLLDRGSMGDEWGSFFDGWDFGPGDMYDFGNYGDVFAQPDAWDFGPGTDGGIPDSFGNGVGWTWEDPADPYYGNGADGGETDWLKKLMPSGDSLLKLLLLGAGGVLGGTNGSKEAGKTTTTTSNVPDWALPYVQGLLAQGAGINAAQGYNQVSRITTCVAKP